MLSITGPKTASLWVTRCTRSFLPVCVNSWFLTSTEFVAESTSLYILTLQYCAVLFCTTQYLTHHWVHPRFHMLFIILIALVVSVAVQYWRVSTIIIILTGFRRFILSLSARTNKMFSTHRVTAQHAKRWASVGGRNLKQESMQHFELELEPELQPEPRAWAWASALSPELRMRAK